MKNKGILLLAKNNEHFNYVKQAATMALAAKHHLQVPVAICAPVSELEELDSTLRKRAFDYEINKSPSAQDNNLRWFKNLEGKDVEIKWRNSLRPEAYDLSPFEETILIDTDYLIQNNRLNQCWGNVEDILMNNEALNIDMSKETMANEKRTSVLGSKMYWATCVYFRKTEKTKCFFNLVKHIQENYLFYRLAYNLPYGIYRNDYAFTIAAFMMNDFAEDGIAPLPVPMLNSYFEDRIYSVEKDTVTILSDILVNVSKMNIHLMNKFSLEEYLDDLIKAY